jgi:hypothetical protein
MIVDIKQQLYFNEMRTLWANFRGACPHLEFYDTGEDKCTHPECSNFCDGCSFKECPVLDDIN